MGASPDGILFHPANDVTKASPIPESSEAVASDSEFAHQQYSSSQPAAQCVPAAGQLRYSSSHAGSSDVEAAVLRADSHQGDEIASATHSDALADDIEQLLQKLEAGSARSNDVPSTSSDVGESAAVAESDRAAPESAPYADDAAALEPVADSSGRGSRDVSSLLSAWFDPIKSQQSVAGSHSELQNARQQTQPAADTMAQAEFTASSIDNSSAIDNPAPAQVEGIAVVA